MKSEPQLRTSTTTWCTSFMMWQLWTDSSPKMALHSFSDFSSQHKNRRILPHHGRRDRLIRRQCHWATPMILYPKRAHRIYFIWPPLDFFFGGWLVSGEPPTRRAVLPVLPRRHQRRMWVDWSNKRFNLQGKWLPTEWYYHNIQLLTAGAFFLRLVLCWWSPYVELCW